VTPSADNPSSRSIADIRKAGAAWVSETELGWLCDQVEGYRRKRPLAVRLRSEAAEWDDGETIAPLLLEAAEAIEHLAARVAELEYERR